MQCLSHQSGYDMRLGHERVSKKGFMQVVYLHVPSIINAKSLQKNCFSPCDGEL